VPKRPKQHKPTGYRPPKKTKRQYDQHRGSAHARGYNYQWRKRREIFLGNHPLCCRCKEADRIEAATVVDHIIPHRGDQRLFWDEENNWQPLCKACHDKKTATEDRLYSQGEGVSKT